MLMRRYLLLVFCILGLQTPAWAANPMVEMRTNLGSVTLELYPDQAPKTVANFLQYVKAGFYNGTVFHRVIDGFMVQGGGFTAGMLEKPTRPPIENEAKNGLKNTLGSLAMARTRDPHSAAAQFYINVANNTFLDHPGQDGWGYAVFGKVTQGLDIVQKIAKVRTGFQDQPSTPVLIESMRLLPAPK